MFSAIALEFRKQKEGKNLNQDFFLLLVTPKLIEKMR